MIPEKPLSHHQVSIHDLQSRPVYMSYSDNTLHFSLDNLNIERVECEKFRGNIIKTDHTKRINMVRGFDTTLVTCSNDRSIKLWDVRTSHGSNISTFKRNKEFYSVFLQENILAAGSNGEVILLDLRTGEEIRILEESFNGDVTDLLMKDNRLTGCSTDGIVTTFDLSIQNEEEATQWVFMLDHPPQSFKQIDEYTLLNTTDSLIYMLQEDKLIKKVEPNSTKQPRHLLWSNYDKNSHGDIEYYTWNSTSQRVQYWKGEQLMTNSQEISDIDFLEDVGTGLVGVGSNGRIFHVKQMPVKIHNHPKISEDEEKEMQEQDIVKPKYKNGSSKHGFKPF